jgi:hypothetical protein
VIQLLAQRGQLLLDGINMVWRTHGRNYSRTPARFCDASGNVGVHAAALNWALLFQQEYRHGGYRTLGP